MEPYTKAGIARKLGKKVPEEEDLPPTYYDFELVGVLVHSGTILPLY